MFSPHDGPVSLAVEYVEYTKVEIFYYSVSQQTISSGTSLLHDSRTLFLKAATLGAIGVEAAAS